MTAASELVDEVGIDAFSMRALGERLNTSTATLYRHVAGKRELMVYVVDRLFGEIYAGRDLASLPGSWQTLLEEDSIRFHEGLSRHPNVLPLIITQVPIGPNALALRERMIGALIGFGFSAALAARAFTTLAQYVIGFATLQYSPDAPGPAEAGDLGDYYKRLDCERYPAIVASADALTAVPLAEEFREGLRFVIDGIDRSRRRR